ncbi:MAG: hypothetical protein Q8W51_07270 [Candidatus Palauibacterales bacterium]|nr:hypothetical protein [Candidatus Palauibacterales bacterium]MDP2529522.1 hypothetical protein [Candidatus Palauibacterales bacterium]MDP2584138.1 hypothetical protein [Candidatus Palauibacterales bacterium]
MSGRLQDLQDRRYPQTWLLLEAVEAGPRLLGREVVDLSPGAIELRHAARALRGYAEEREHWLVLDAEERWARLGEGHRRELSFGPEIRYCVERDGRGHIHAGRPLRHLALDFRNRSLTPATSAEIGLYFYGRRPAVFGLIGPERVHGFIGFEWEALAGDDVRWLLEREMGERR